MDSYHERPRFADCSDESCGSHTSSAKQRLFQYESCERKQYLLFLDQLTMCEVEAEVLVLAKKGLRT